MALLTFSASALVTQFNPFAADTDHNFEGDATVQFELTATSLLPTAVLRNGLEWWCVDGGWVVALWVKGSGNTWGLGPNIGAAPATVSWPTDIYDPVLHALFMVQVGDPTNAQPDEWAVAQASVSVDASTQFIDTVERAPEVISDPPVPILVGTPSGVPDPVFLAVMAPVPVLDLVFSEGGALIKKRMLVLSGQVVNWLKDPGVLQAIQDPQAAGASAEFRVVVEDLVAGRIVVDERYRDPSTGQWRADLGAPGPGFTLGFDDRVAMFRILRELPAAFSFGTLTLEFTWPGGSATRRIPIGATPADVFRWPVKMGPDQRLLFGNGLTPGFNSHTLSPHQHLAYDITVFDSTGADSSPGQTLAAVATGTIAGVEDAYPENPVPPMTPQRANRFFLEHEHPGGPRYTVYAHILRNSANRAPTLVPSGNGIASIGNNGQSSGPHLHLAHYRLNRFGRFEALPMAFALRQDASSETVIGVPAGGLMAQRGPLPDPNDPVVDKLEVLLTTADRPLAGTDDDVSVTLGGRTFNLDDPNRNDFERAHTDVFQIPPWPGLRRSMLLGPIRIHKSPDGLFGGWRLDRVQVRVNGATLFDRGGLNYLLSSAPQVNTLDWNETIS